MRERCHRCHTILTSEDKHWYGVSCDECEQDYRYEEWERHRAVKPTGAGEPSALACVFCAALLAPEETYCCESCADSLASADPNFNMTGEDDGKGD